MVGSSDVMVVLRDNCWVGPTVIKLCNNSNDGDIIDTDTSQFSDDTMFWAKTNKKSSQESEAAKILQTNVDVMIKAS